MRILMAMHSLAMGGAEKFFTNLACALAEQHEVTCYVPALGCGDPMMKRRLNGLAVRSIPLFTTFGYRVFYKLTLLLQRRFPGFDPEAMWHDRNLRALHRRHHFDIVNSQLMEGTRQVCRAFEHTRLPLTESDHGDFAMINPHQPGRNAVIFRRLDALICPAEANECKARSYPWREDIKLEVIRYGYRPSPDSHAALPTKPGIITFGLLARGVVEKGWEEALAAARFLRQRSARPIRLVFVGAGPCIDQIARNLTDEEREWILMPGQQENPEAWIRGFDVGLLPTHLAGESLPNTIIEYLACGKPVIATNIGGIPEMIHQAGRLIPLGAGGRADVTALADAMSELLDDEVRESYRARAAGAFMPYSMPVCVASYERLFTRLLAKA